jgi:uncharacterized membrane protein
VDLYLIILRIVHILTGVFWVGSGLFFFFLLEPAVNELGPQGAPVMRHLAQKKKMPVVIVSASALTVLAGLLLYWRDSNGFDLDWVTSPTGLAFGLGGIAAIVAFLMGFVAIKPRVDRMGAIGADVAAAGGTPSQAQLAEIQGIQHSLRRIGLVDMLLLTFAVLTMATARFL